MTSESRSILITGGAGFIGCELSSRLVDQGDRVTVMDVLHPQVHHRRGLPERLRAEVTLLPVDVTSASSWDATLRIVQPDCVVHLAAETGTGQSLTEASRHGSTNVVGTTRMTDALGATGIVPGHVLVASSRAVYGEGQWTGGADAHSPGGRSHADLEAARWNPVDPNGSGPLSPLASVAERTPAMPTSIYGATKLAQEHILGAWCAAKGAALSVLRLQNVYGPGQSLGNPYTGIVTLFARQARSREEIDVYEDGEIVRDFVFIDDVVDAMMAALDHPPRTRRTVDIGSGRPTTVMELAEMLAKRLDAPAPRISGRFRDGDVRAAFADIAPAGLELGWTPSWTIEDGMEELLAWMERHPEEASR